MSDYLDNMNVSEGDVVKCKSDIINGNFTPGWLYQVMHEKEVIDDTGVLVKPSARFEMLKGI